MHVIITNTTVTAGNVGDGAVAADPIDDLTGDRAQPARSLTSDIPDPRPHHGKTLTSTSVPVRWCRRGDLHHYPTRIPAWQLRGRVANSACRSVSVAGVVAHPRARWRSLGCCLHWGTGPTPVRTGRYRRRRPGSSSGPLGTSASRTSCAAGWACPGFGAWCRPDLSASRSELIGRRVCCLVGGAR